jgi:hypothetical protein
MEILGVLAQVSVGSRRWAAGMATAPAAGRRRLPGFPAVAALVTCLLVAAQSAALAHEIEHVLHQHGAPCALHVAADHLAMAPAPDPGSWMLLAPSQRSEYAPPSVRPAPPPPPDAARSPPVWP